MMVIVGSKLHEFARATDTVALLSVRIRVSEDCILVPDICLAHRTRPREDVIVTPPLLCVEILAEKDTFSEMRDRVARFLAMGVANIWIVDQWGKFGFVASRDGFLKPELGVFVIDGTPIQISLVEILADLEDF